MRNALWLIVFLSFSAQSPLAPNAPADKPVDVRSEAQFKKLKAAIAPFVADARKTWPAAKARYLKGLKPGESLFVSAELNDKKHHVEIVFIGVRKVAGAEISGNIESQLTPAWRAPRRARTLKGTPGIEQVDLAWMDVPAISTS